VSGYFIISNWPHQLPNTRDKSPFSLEWLFASPSIILELATLWSLLRAGPSPSGCAKHSPVVTFPSKLVPTCGNLTCYNRAIRLRVNLYAGNNGSKYDVIVIGGGHNAW